MEDKRIRIVIQVDNKDVARGVSETNTQLSSLDKTIGRISRSMAAFAAIWAGRAIIGGIADTIKFTGNLSMQLALVGRASGITGSEIDNLKQSFFGLSTSLGVPIEQLVELGIMAGRAGISTVSDMLQIAETASKMGATTDLSATEAATALIKLANAMKLPISQSNKIASVISFVGKKTAASEAEITGAMYRMATAGKNLNVTIPELAVIAGMTIEVGVAAERAGTQWNRAMIEIANKTGQAASVVGITRGEFKKLVETDTVDAFIQLAMGLSRISSETERLKKINEIFGAVGARSFAPFINALDKFIPLLSEANKKFEEGNEVTNDYAAIQDEFNIKLNKAKESFKALGESIVKDFLPPLGDAAEKLSKFLDKLREVERLEKLRQQTDVQKAINRGEAIPMSTAALTGTIDDFVKARKQSVRPKREGFMGENPQLTPPELLDMIDATSIQIQQIAEERLPLDKYLFPTQDKINEKSSELTIWLDSFTQAIMDKAGTIDSFIDSIMTETVDIIVKASSAMYSGFGNAMAQIIVVGGKTRDIFKAMWEDIAMTVISLIAQMTAKLLAFMALMVAANMLGVPTGATSGFRGFIKAITGFQEGGIVPGMGYGDKVPALLEPGELIVPRKDIASVMNNQRVNVNVSMAGAMILDDPTTVSRLYREYLRDEIQNDIWVGRDKFYG